MKRICAAPECSKLFDPFAVTHLYCSKQCGIRMAARAYRARIAVACLGCGTPTNAKGRRCRMCTNVFRSATTLDTTLGEHYEKVRFIRRNPAQKNTQIRLLAKYHNRNLIGRACQQCGYSAHTEVCHIKPIRTFSLDTPIRVVNAASNIAILCPNHHWELDHGLLTRKTLRKR